MSVTVLTNSKWQPSVLHLLPFSNNNAGSTIPSRLPSSNGHVSYSDTSRGFPVLAVTRSEKEKQYRSKSATTPNCSAPSPSNMSDRKHSRSQQHRLLRASSERLSRGQAYSNANSKMRARAKSEYEINSIHRKKPETVKISVNDINNQILGKNPDESNGSSSPESGVYKAITEHEKTKPLPKPALKGLEGKWPQTSTKFWKSSATSPGEVEIRMHKANLDLRASNAGFRRIKRVKLNVNELPRSKTPIAENDPDKLNMKHVIAFLQSSGKDKDDAEDEDTMKIYNQRPSHGGSALPTKHVSSTSMFSSSRKNGIVFDKKNRAIKSDNGTSLKSESQVNAVNQNQEVTPHRYPNSRPKSYSYDHNNNQNKMDSFVNDKGSSGHGNVENVSNAMLDSSSFEDRHKNTETLHNRLASFSNNNVNNLKLSDYKSEAIDKVQYYDLKERPLSMQTVLTAQDSPDFHIPPNIRKIRDHGQDNKPFRLHRFLTLVPNGSESLMNIADKFPAQVVSKSRPHSREVSRSVASVDKTDRFSKPSRRSHSGSRYYISGSGVSSDRPRSKGDRHSLAKLTHSANNETRQFPNVNKVICLPRAHFEADSDEEIGPFSTVPSARNRRALTLSAKGRAIRDKAGNRETSSRPNSTKGKKTSDNENSHFVNPVPPIEKSNEKTNGHSEITKPYANAEWPDLQQPNQFESTSTEGQQPFSQTSYTAAKLKLVSFEDQPAQKTKPLTSQSPPLLNLNHNSKFSLENNYNETFLTLPSDLDSPEENVDKPQRNTGKVQNGSSPSPTEHVKLSLRKERNRTRVSTYMTDMEGNAEDVDPTASFMNSKS